MNSLLEEKKKDYPRIVIGTLIVLVFVLIFGGWLSFGRDAYAQANTFVIDRCVERIANAQEQQVKHLKDIANILAKIERKIK